MPPLLRVLGKHTQVCVWGEGGGMRRYPRWGVQPLDVTIGKTVTAPPMTCHDLVV